MLIGAGQESVSLGHAAPIADRLRVTDGRGVFLQCSRPIAHLLVSITPDPVQLIKMRLQVVAPCFGAGLVGKREGLLITPQTGQRLNFSDRGDRRISDAGFPIGYTDCLVQRHKSFLVMMKFNQTGPVHTRIPNAGGRIAEVFGYTPGRKHLLLCGSNIPEEKGGRCPVLRSLETPACNDAVSSPSRPPASMSRGRGPSRNSFLTSLGSRECAAVSSVLALRVGEIRCKRTDLRGKTSQFTIGRDLADMSIKRFCITTLLCENTFNSLVKRLCFNPVILPGKIIGTLKKTV